MSTRTYATSPHYIARVKEADQRVSRNGLRGIVALALAAVVASGVGATSIAIILIIATLVLMVNATLTAAVDNREHDALADSLKRGPVLAISDESITVLGQRFAWEDIRHVRIDNLPFRITRGLGDRNYGIGSITITTDTGDHRFDVETLLSRDTLRCAFGDVRESSTARGIAVTEATTFRQFFRS